MPLSLHRASVPVFLRALGLLSTLLDKAAAHAEAGGTDPAELIGARLAPDMYPLSRQIQAASDAAKSGAARLSGRAIPSFPDVETTFPELQERIAKTIAFLGGIGEDEIADDAARPITLTLRGTPVTFRADDYLLTFALPNFFFHVTTAYDILRHKGLAIGKMDFLGPR